MTTYFYECKCGTFELHTEVYCQSNYDDMTRQIDEHNEQCEIGYDSMRWE